MNQKFDFSLFISCLSGGIVGGILSGIFYNRTYEMWHPVLVVGTYFAIVAFCISCCGVVSEMCTSHLSGRRLSVDVFVRTMGLLLLTPVVFLAAGAILQFIYGLVKTEQVTMDATEFIIMIDNSGSTATTDPQEERFSSVVEFVENMNQDQSIMITIFSSKAKLVYPMTQKNQDMAQDVEEILSQYEADGGTNIQGALEVSLENYKVSDEKAVALLFSDGESKVNMDRIAQAYIDIKVPIFTISFAGTNLAGQRLLVEMAERTGGAYLEIGEGLSFQDSYQKVQNYAAKRILLDRRGNQELGKVWYTLLRIIFLAILVVLLGLVLAVLLDSEEILQKNLLPRIGLGLAAGCIVEFGFKAYLYGAFLRGILCILMSLVFANYIIPNYSMVSSYELGGRSDNKKNGLRKKGNNEKNAFDTKQKNYDTCEFEIGKHSDKPGRR